MNWKKPDSAEKSLKPGARVNLRMVIAKSSITHSTRTVLQFSTTGTVVEVRSAFRIEMPRPEFDNEPPVRPVIVLWHDGRHGCHDASALEVVG